MIPNLPTLMCKPCEGDGSSMLHNFIPPDTRRQVSVDICFGVDPQFRIMLINPFRDLREVPAHVGCRDTRHRLASPNISIKNETDVAMAHDSLAEKIYAMIWIGIREVGLKGTSVPASSCAGNCETHRHVPISFWGDPGTYPHAHIDSAI